MSNRAAVKRRIVTLATVAVAAVDLGVPRRAPEKVKVAYSTPPDTATSTSLYFAGFKTAGTIEPTGMRRTSPRTSDTFTIQGTIDAFGFGSDEAAEEGAERILNAFRVVLDRCQALVDTSHVVPDGDPGSYQVQWATVGEWSMTPYAPIGDTHVARIEFTVTCSTPNA